MLEVIGEISLNVINLLNLPLKEATPIYLGATNIAHMKSEHRYEFEKFYDKLPFILSTADYVRLRSEDSSIEYIKFIGKHIKLAVRVAGDGNYYARSLYFIELNRVENLRWAVKVNATLVRVNATKCHKVAFCPSKKGCI